MSQRMLVQIYKNRNQRHLYMRYSTNPEADLKVLLERIKSLEIKADLLRP